MGRLLILALVSTFLGLGCKGPSKYEGSGMQGTPTATPSGELPNRVGQPGAPNIEPQKVANKVDCKNKNDTRTLEMRAKGKGCELAYIKGGQEGIVATSSNGTGHCDKSMAKIQERLKSSGFTCQ